IGHSGFGELTWILAPGGAGLLDVARVSAWASVVAGFVVAALGLETFLPFIVISGLVTSLLVLAGFLVRATQPFLSLRSGAVYGYRIGGRYHFNYAMISNAHVEGDALPLTFHGQEGPLRLPIKRTHLTSRGPSDDELNQLTAQLISAAQRAQGAGP